MQKPVTFLHVADVRLGAPAHGLSNLTDDWATKVARSIPASFDRAIDTAVARAVDFVVLAGDTFDSSRASYAEHVRFFDALARLEAVGIPVYIVAGNRDPYPAWARDLDRLPASAHVIGADGPESVVFGCDGASTCVISREDLLDPAWLAQRHPGRARGVQAVDIAETGECGCYLVTLEEAADCSGDTPLRHLESSAEVAASAQDGNRQQPQDDNREQHRRSARDGKGGGMPQVQPDVESVPTSSIVFANVRVDAGACLTLGDLVRLVAASLLRESGMFRCDDMIARVVLEGATDLHRFLANPRIRADLRKQVNDAYPNLFCDALVDCTRPRQGLRTPADGPLFHRVLTGIADEQRVREETMINYIQSEFVKRGIAVPESLSQQIGAFDAAAETLVLDLLGGGEE